MIQIVILHSHWRRPSFDDNICHILQVVWQHSLVPFLRYGNHTICCLSFWRSFGINTTKQHLFSWGECDTDRRTIIIIVIVRVYLHLNKQKTKPNSSTPVDWQTYEINCSRPGGFPAYCVVEVQKNSTEKSRNLNGNDGENSRRLDSHLFSHYIILGEKEEESAACLDKSPSDPSTPTFCTLNRTKSF